MKVTALETLQVAEFPFLFWLRVHTDAGIIGTGETFWAPGPVASYIHDNVAPYLIGKDPRDIELHDRTLGSVYVGARDAGAEVRGNSAVNIALWDIYGQALGEPLWQPPGPNGFSDQADGWASAEGMKIRLDIAWQAARQVKDIGNPNDMLDALIGPAASPETRQAVARAESKQQGLALLLMAPEFQRR